MASVTHEGSTHQEKAVVFYPLFDRLRAAENAFNDLTLVTDVPMRVGHNVVFSFLL